LSSNKVRAIELKQGLSFADIRTREVDMKFFDSAAESGSNECATRFGKIRYSGGGEGSDEFAFLDYGSGHIRDYPLSGRKAHFAERCKFV
jgi:hypothetical protein